ncbi:MAG: cytochrome c3 family protein [Anaerolinea sp.]|nr:cytochrome c3 family protein [Anaerolinea sp.]
MSIPTRHLTTALIGAALTCITAGLIPLIALAQTDTVPPDPVATESAEGLDPAQMSPTALTEGSGPSIVYPISGEPTAPTGDNSYCLLCHARPGRLVTLGSGEVLNLFVSTDTLRASIHGTRSQTGALGCVDCHGANAFPHSGPSPSDSRSYSINAVQMCVNCHADQVDILERGLHAQAIRAGNFEAAVCTDCHGAHEVEAVTRYPQLVAAVCGDCHIATFQEWRVSAHADMGNAGCSSCHSPHAQTLRTGDNSTELCLNCHEEMTPLLVHIQHAGDEYPVACVVCHMYTPEQSDTIQVSFAQMPSGHSMRMDSTPCTTCHERLVAEGRWDRLIANNQVEAVGAVEEGTAAARGSDDFVQLLQGLILGLGFGATAAAIFIARGNHAISAARTAPAPSNLTAEPQPVVAPEATNSPLEGDQQQDAQDVEQDAQPLEDPATTHDSKEEEG